MKKIRPMVVSIILIIAVLFTSLAFLLPFEREGTFWISYIAGMIAIILQIPVFKIAYPSETELKSKVLGYPVYKVGITYLAVQLILSTVLFALGDNIGPMLAALLCILVLGISVIFGITASMAREAIQNMETVKSVDTQLMKSLAVRAQALTSRTSDPVLMKELKKLSEDISFSDPVSSPLIVEHEQNLLNAFNQLESAVVSKNEGAVDLCRNVAIALNDRNTACKANK